MNRWIQWSFLGAGLFFLGAVLFWSESPSPSGASAGGMSILDPEPLSGPAPMFSLMRRDGGWFQMEKLRGQFVLVNFWATWCEPCLEELPHLLFLAQELEKLPVTFVLVSADNEWKDIDDLIVEIEKLGLKDFGQLLRGQKAKVIMLLDPQANVAKSYGTVKYPETYWIDPQGALQLKFIGPRAWKQKPVVDFFKKLLGEDPISD